MPKSHRHSSTVNTSYETIIMMLLFEVIEKLKIMGVPNPHVSSANALIIPTNASNIEINLLDTGFFLGFKNKIVHAITLAIDPLSAFTLSGVLKIQNKNRISYRIDS